MAELERKREEGASLIRRQGFVLSVAARETNALRKAVVDLTQLEAHFGEHTHRHTYTQHTQSQQNG